MSVAALLADLAALGVRLTPAGSGLRYQAPRGVVTPELAEAVRAHRDELIELLRHRKHDGGPALGYEAEHRDGALLEIGGPGLALWLADVDRDWDLALERADAGFRAAGRVPTAEDRRGAAAFEMRRIDDRLTADLGRDLAGAIYAGRLVARLAESGEVRVEIRGSQ